MKSLIWLTLLLFFSLPVIADSPSEKRTGAEPGAVLSLREVRYDGKLSEDEAKFIVDIEAEATGKSESSLKLFEGDIALLPTKLPDQLKIVREGNRYLLTVAHPGRFKFKVELVAKIQRAEPWNQISFTGPVAAIASVNALASGAGMEVQLLSGTLLESVQTNGVSRVKGFLGADQTIALRWQGKVAEVARKALLTADTTVTALITPTVVKYTTQIRFDILQGNVPRLTLALPATQALTRLVGEQIRDWQIKPDGDRQILSVEFIKPVEKNCTLTLHSEQTVEITTAATQLNPPQPLEIERESGAFTISAEDTLVEIESLTGLRQVNASGDALAACRFNARPFTLVLKLKRIEPVLNVDDRITARLEETRLVVSHMLALNVEKAGIYSAELHSQPGFVVADVRGGGVEDWKISDGKLRVNFSARVLGRRELIVQIEQALKDFPRQITVAPMRVAGAGKESAQIGAASAPGIRVKPGELVGLREISVNRLPNRTDELLAFTAEQPDWELSLASERLAARIVAEVFNLVTIGDGLVGGSATIRYGIVNQGVQEFRVKLPPHCKNIEFTGANIRRKELAGDVWTIGLQDKVWGGYTLVVTYDHQFDPQVATALPVGGIHALDVERETGSIAITTAASLKLNAKPVGDPLRAVDEFELSAADRALITRSVLLAYQYTGDSYDLSVEVQRHALERVLEAVADRTQITSVLTDAGQLLTQASFMVKNNEKQFQKFKLPRGAKLWGCYVNGQSAKPERDNDGVLVPLPRDANRDQAFTVDIVYAETTAAIKSRWSQALKLIAPKTDVPNTYAEWHLYAPAGLRLSAFGGTMSVAQGTTYEMLDAWKKFLSFYGQVLREAGPGIFIIGVLALLVITLVISAVRRGWSGIITVLVVVAIVAVLASMMLPALSKAKARSQTISALNSLKQIGLAAQMFANDNDGRLPTSYEEMMNELNTDKVTIDPATGQRFVYLGGGMKLGNLKPDSVLAYSPLFNNTCSVLFADGHTEMVRAERFAELSQRGLLQLLSPQQIAQSQQQSAIMNAQLQPQRPTATLAPPAGRRSIRIDLPRTGEPIVFTRALNIEDRPLAIEAKMMSLHKFQTFQMAWQVAAFLLGLAACWWQWRRAQSNSFILTVALALVIVSVCSLLIAWRALHDVLIVGFPAVVVALLAFLIWKYWPRQKPDESHPPLMQPEAGMPPVAAAIALLLTLSVASARADEVVRAPEPLPAPVSILAASYTGTVNDRVALLETTLQLSSARPEQTIPLFGDDVAVQQFNVKAGEAKLVRDGRNIAVRLGKRGEATVQLRMLVKVCGDVTKRHLTFAIPQALSSQVALTLDQPEADVDFPTAISFKRAMDKEKTRVEAVIGSGANVELLWTPRVKRAAEVAATVFCQNMALVALGSGVVNVRATLDYQVTQGELRQARVRLPAGQRLLRVEGAGIRTWEIKEEDGGQVLVVELLKGTSPAWRLTVETEKVLDAVPANVAVELPRALDVKRETGLVALRGAEELSLSVQSVADLQRVDAEEFARVRGEKTPGLLSVFRFLKPEFALQVHAEAVQPQIEAIVRNHIRIGTDQVGISSLIEYTIKRAGVFGLKVALPEGYRVENVAGSNLLQWIERPDNGTRLLEVTLKERTSGAYSLRVELAKSFKELPKSLVVTGVHPLDTVKLTGFVAVTAEPGVATRTESFDGLTEIPAISLPDHATLNVAGSVLAYKFISPEPKSASEWKLNVATEAIESWVRAEIVNTLTLSEVLVSGRALVRYDIANAPVKELRLKVPAAFKNVEISGPNIRRRDQDGDVWRVELQGKTRGFYTLTVTWEQPRASRTNSVELAGVAADGVERETGLLAVVARPPLHITELKAQDLTKVDTRDLPEWAGRPEEATVLAYRYVRPGYQLALDARQLLGAEQLKALVDSARLTTVVADDGQMMTEMSLAVRNNGEQFIEIELPPGATVWSAFVAGQPVRPSKREGKLLLPLEQSGADDAPVTVELTYVGTNSFPRMRGQMGFTSPKLNVPLKNARWELFLPPDFDYRDFAGTMGREVAAKPSLLSFSLSEYIAMEKSSKASSKAEILRDVSKAQSNLSSGNVREAVVNYKRAKGNRYAGKGEAAEVDKLESQLRSVQAGNLIQAQQEFSLNNAAPAGQPQQTIGGQAPVQYDNAAAEAQWTKLAQAQEVAAAKVQPLRVNLPLRGLRHAFTQVLQTEPNVPMTIQLSAVNTKTGNWLKQIGMGLAGFLALWGLVAVVAARKQK